MWNLKLKIQIEKTNLRLCNSSNLISGHLPDRASWKLRTIRSVRLSFMTIGCVRWCGEELARAFEKKERSHSIFWKVFWFQNKSRVTGYAIGDWPAGCLACWSLDVERKFRTSACAWSGASSWNVQVERCSRRNAHTVIAELLLKVFWPHLLPVRLQKTFGDFLTELGPKCHLFCVDAKFALEKNRLN